MPAPADPGPRRSLDEPPPVGRTWPRVYAFVLGVLALNIVLLYLLMRTFS